MIPQASNLVTWNIELTDKKEGAYIVERITCLGLAIQPYAVLAMEGDPNNATIIKAWATGTWRRVWRSEIQPAANGGNA